jgi:hypothetical protein
VVEKSMQHRSLAIRATMVCSPSYDVCRNHCHPAVSRPDYW